MSLQYQCNVGENKTLSNAIGTNYRVLLKGQAD